MLHCELIKSCKIFVYLISGLYSFFQKLCAEKKEDHSVLKCYLLIVKYGPLSGLPASILRNDFTFLTKLCQMIGPNSTKLLQEEILDIALIFCKHVSKIYT